MLLKVCLVFWCILAPDPGGKAEGKHKHYGKQCIITALIADNKLLQEHVSWTRPPRDRHRNWAESQKPFAHCSPAPFRLLSARKTRTTSIRGTQSGPSLPLWLRFSGHFLLGRHCAKGDFTVRASSHVILSATSAKSQINKAYRQSPVTVQCHTSCNNYLPAPHHTQRHFPSSSQDLVQGMSRPLMLANKAAVCLIGDCCHGYSKQGEQGLCL